MTAIKEKPPLTRTRPHPVKLSTLRLRCFLWLESHWIKVLQLVTFRTARVHPELGVEFGGVAQLMFYLKAWSLRKWRTTDSSFDVSEWHAVCGMSIMVWRRSEPQDCYRPFQGTVNVKPGLQWRTHDVRDSRTRKNLPMRAAHIE